MEERKDSYTLLKPCPFCGSEARLLHHTNTDGVVIASYVQCTDYNECGMHFDGIKVSAEYSADQKAITRWNTRYEEIYNGIKKERDSQEDLSEDDTILHEEKKEQDGLDFYVFIDNIVNDISSAIRQAKEKYCK